MCVQNEHKLARISESHGIFNIFFNMFNIFFLQKVSLSEREYLKSKTHEQLAASRRLIEDQEQELDVRRAVLNLLSVFTYDLIL